MEVAEPIVTDLGLLRGRDAIYVDRLEQIKGKVEISGEINGRLAGDKRNEWVSFSISFSGVLALEVQETDICRWQIKSSFDEVIESSWLDTLGLGQANRHRHFVVSGYDSIIRVAAEDFTIRFGRVRQM